MFEIDLFLGFPVDPLYQAALSKANPKIIAQFVQGSGDYLIEVLHRDMRFLGKNIGKMITLAELELLEKNIYSLLKRLVSEFPYEETPLYLFPIEKSSNNE